MFDNDTKSLQQSLHLSSWSKLLATMFWIFQFSSCQVTFSSVHEEKLSQIHFQSDLFGFTLSSVIASSTPGSGLTQYKYLTVDQYRQVTLHFTVELNGMWAFTHFPASSETCDQLVNIPQIINIPTSNYFYGVFLRITAQSSNCSTGLRKWDLTPSGGSSFLSSTVLTPSTPLQEMVIAYVEPGSLILSNQSTIRLSDSSHSYLSGQLPSLRLLYLLPTVSHNFPVWGVDQSTTTIRMFELTSLTGSFSLLSISGLPATSQLLVGARRLGSTFGHAVLLATQKFAYFVTSSNGNATKLNLTIPVDLNITAITHHDQLSQFDFVVLRGDYLESYSLITSPYSLKLITQVNVSAYNLAPRNIRFADSNTLVGISSTSNRLVFFNSSSSCHIACESCFGEQNTECHKCSPKAIRDVNSSSTCYFCGDGFVAKSDYSSCLPCASGCATCSNRELQPQSPCDVCLPGKLKDASDPKTCMSCPAPSRYVTPSGTCASCTSNCKTCIDSSSCAACDSGFYLSNNPNPCSACDTPNCDLCLSPGNICLKCKPGHFFLTSTQCAQCEDTDCQECFGTGLHKCSQCKDGFYLLTSNNTCQPCLAGCMTCTDSSTCGSCKLGLTMTRGLSTILVPICLNCTSDSGYYKYVANSNRPILKHLSSNCLFKRIL